MRYFSLLDFQYAVLLIFLGLIALILISLAFGPPGREEQEQALEEYPDGIKEKNGPVPPVLLFLYAGFAIWAIVYVVMTGIRGQPF